MAEKLTSVSLWIIEDNPDYRRELTDLLELVDTIECTGSFASYDEVRELFDELELPEIILLDLNLPGTNGLQAISELRRLSPASQVIVITVADHRKTVFDALRAGAAGYLLKSEPFDGIVQHIHEVVSGGIPLSSAVTPFVLDSLKIMPASKTEKNLSDRESEILEMLADGASRGEIASCLSIATTTVDYHLRSVYSKLGVHSTSGAVGKAFRLGLLK
ncbi:response regulator [Tichowtungia aerotolerans]|uniref:Response regulator n=1 Tax=Tichowtungia aerotolerans TaxID=2697043 RepID=A0A6P1M580_9BACT|nr:response regulator transcription factor [Tichowtungia aerotolerans]QHI69949.1 response regulator [Tichowtungia aerotolerans]